MNEALEFYNKHGLEECKRAYALSVNAGCEDLEMKSIIDWHNKILGSRKINVSFVVEQ